MCSGSGMYIYISVSKSILEKMWNTLKKLTIYVWFVKKYKYILISRSHFSYCLIFWIYPIFLLKLTVFDGFFFGELTSNYLPDRPNIDLYYTCEYNSSTTSIWKLLTISGIKPRKFINLPHICLYRVILFIN